MDNDCQPYLIELKKAQETVAELEAALREIKLKLRSDPTHSGYLQELKRLTLDMTITLNQLEHCQSKLDQCNERLAGEK